MKRIGFIDGRGAFFADTYPLSFGSDKDLAMNWDGTRFNVTQLTADSEIRWGVDGAGIDQRWYGDDVGAYMQWDQSAGQLIHTGAGGISFNPTLVPDSARTKFIWSYGTRATAKGLAMVASGDYNLDPVQVNLNIIGAAPISSTVNLSYMNITHAFADMTGLRLKCSDWNIVIQKDILDAYCYQGEIDFTASGIAVGGEAAVMGLVMNAGSNAVTGNLRGLIISMQGSGSYSTVVGLEIRTTCGDVLGHGCSEAIRIAGTPLPVVGIAMGNQTNDNEGPQNAFFFPSIGGADEGPCVASGTATGAITIKIGSATRYIRFWTTA